MQGSEFDPRQKRKKVPLISKEVYLCYLIQYVENSTEHLSFQTEIFHALSPISLHLHLFFSSYLVDRRKAEPFVDCQAEFTICGKDKNKKKNFNFDMVS